MAKITMKQVDTVKAMENLEILLKTFGITKKEAEDGAAISSGYLTRLANPNSGKNMSFDLQLSLEKYLDIPQFSLDEVELDYPTKEDEFIIKVLEKLNRETKSGEREWTENKYETVKKEPYWNELFGVEKATDSPFKGNDEVIRKCNINIGRVHLCGSLFETQIADDQKIIVFQSGIETTDYDIDIDERTGKETPYRILDFRHEVFLQSADGKYRLVGNDFYIGKQSKKLALKYSLERLYNVVQKETKNKMTRDTYNMLSDFLNQ